MVEIKPMILIFRFKGNTMRISLVLILTLLILSALTLSYESFCNAQSAINGAAKERINNNTKLRELMDELQNTVTTLRKERQAYYSEKQEKDREVQDLRIQIQALKATQEELISEAEEVEGEMKTLNNDGKGLQTSISDYQKKEDKLSKSVFSYVKRLREQVDNGIPFQRKERTAKLDTIANGIDATEQMDIAEACNQLWSFCKDELRLAVTSETYRDTIRLADGREPHAEFVRVGKIILAFTTEDGKDAGVWLSGSEAAAATGWVYDPSNASLHSILKAIKIHKRQHPPEIINFPISFSPENIHHARPHKDKHKKKKKKKLAKQDKE